MSIDLKDYNKNLSKIFDDPDLSPIDKLKHAIKYTEKIDIILEDSLFVVSKPTNLIDR